MMGLTKKGEYAIRGIVYLAQQAPGPSVLMDEIAAATQAPPQFLAKIFQSFVKAGIVHSFRGAGGGFSLGRPAAQISLREVVEAVVGPILPNRCLVREGACDRDGFCKVHQVWHQVQQGMLDVLGGVTIADLAKND
jgi:Rrf2 family transcriptional regulator, iron-sulfur cluster assembly transcription factor